MTPRPSGEETREILTVVLEDEAERRMRQEVGTEPKDRNRFAKMAVVPLAVVALWFVVAPPAMLLPPPAPAPTVEDVQDGLHMDIYVAAAQVIAYRAKNGRLPDDLIEALAKPESAEGLTYTRGFDGTFEIVGARADQVVVYTSTEPLTQFVAGARAAVMDGNGS